MRASARLRLPFIAAARPYPIGCTSGSAIRSSIASNSISVCISRVLRTFEPNSDRGVAYRVAGLPYICVAADRSRVCGWRRSAGIFHFPSILPIFVSHPFLPSPPALQPLGLFSLSQSLSAVIYRELSPGCPDLLPPQGAAPSGRYLTSIVLASKSAVLSDTHLIGREV